MASSSTAGDAGPGVGQRAPAADAAAAATSAAAARAAIQDVFAQLVRGCGNPFCPNTNCASSYSFAPDGNGDAGASSPPPPTPPEAAAAARAGLAGKSLSFAPPPPPLDANSAAARALALVLGPKAAAGAASGAFRCPPVSGAFFPPPADAPLSLGLFRTALDAAHAEGSPVPLVHYLGRVFSHPDLLSAAFVLEGCTGVVGGAADPATPPSPAPPPPAAATAAVNAASVAGTPAPPSHPAFAALGEQQVAALALDADAVGVFYRELGALAPPALRDAVVGAVLTNSAYTALELRLRASTLQSPLQLRPFLLLLSNPAVWEEQRHHREILLPLFQGIGLLPHALQRWLVRWFRSLRAEELRRLVGSVKQTVTLRMMLPPRIDSLNRDEQVTSAMVPLRLLFEANTLAGEPVPPAEFFHELISDELDLREDLRNWLTRSGFSFCSVPFVLTPVVKSNIRRLESVLMMRRERDDAFRAAFHLPHFGMLGGRHALPYLVIHVEREHLIPTSLAQLSAQRPEDLRKELKVEFENEDGIDEGGVQKEWFMLLVRQIFDEKFGMFTLNTETNTYWFSPSSTDFDEFRLIGMLVGLAIYNSVLLDLHLPDILYRKLAAALRGERETPTLADLAGVSPSLALGLRRLLEFEPAEDVEEVVCRTFQIEYHYFDTTATHDLKPNGADIPVTGANRAEFVDLYVRWLLEGSVERQFAAFRQGFEAVCGKSAVLPLFRWEELALLVCGSPELDLKQLEKIVTYDNGYSKDHPVIRNFWEVLHSFTTEQQRGFLKFCTGTDRAPVGGFENLQGFFVGGQHVQFVISLHGEDDDRLPSSHTCLAGDARVSLPQGFSRSLGLMVRRPLPSPPRATSSCVSEEEADASAGACAMPSVAVLARGAHAGVLRTARPNAGFARGRRLVVELVLQDGRTLRCTPDHRLLALDRKTGAVRWAAAADLRVRSESADPHRLFVGPDAPLEDEPSPRTGAWAGGGGACFRAADLAFDPALPKDTPRLLAFFRLLGALAPTRGDVLASGCARLPSAFDREAFAADVELVVPGGLHDRGAGGLRASGPLSLALPRALVHAVAAMRTADNTLFPRLLVEGPAPLACWREFLAGLLCACGRPPCLHRAPGGFSRLDGVAYRLPASSGGAASARVLRQALWDRFGVRTTIVPEESEAVAAAVGPDTDTLHPASAPSTAATVEVRIADGVRFGERVGVRYSVRMWMLLSAAVACWRCSAPAPAEFLAEAGCLHWFSDSPPLEAPATFSLEVVARRQKRRMEEVYDLSVPEGRSFLANGVLVHNCFHHFLLPPYSSKEKMRRLLLLAIENSEGFGMI